MKFHKKGLLSLALSSLTFLSSCGAPSSSAMNETCSVLDYLIQGTDSVAETSPSYVCLIIFSKPVLGALYGLVVGLAGEAYNIFKKYKVINEAKQTFMKFLQENSCGEITKPVYIKRQEGPYWCWIATIQGIINKIKPGNELSQEEIYKLTHNGKRPAYFECCRNNIEINLPAEDCDALLCRDDRDYTRILAKISDKLNTGESDLYSFHVFDMNGHTKEDFRKIMNLLIDTFGSCFGMYDPVVANVTKRGHVVLLSDYDATTEKLTFEEPYYVNRYQLELDKFAKLCESGKLKVIINGKDTEFPFCLSAIIGFTKDIDKSGYYTIDWMNGQPTLTKNKNALLLKQPVEQSSDINNKGYISRLFE